jgi:hypothetical protein
VSIELASLLTPDVVQNALTKFWGEQLRVVQNRDRLVLALPLMDPDGWQIVVSLQPISGTRAIISDRGETLARLDNSGLDLEGEGTGRLLESRLKVFELLRDGYELKKEIALPLDGVDVQLFGEALVSLGHLLYRHEPAKLRAEHVYHQVRGLLLRQHLKFIEGPAAVIPGRTEKSISIDFLVQGRCSIACKTVERRGRMREYMEQWGYRWLDAKSHDSKLIAAMFFDPENQQWDEGSLAIGREVCQVFHPYHAVDEIQRDLDRYARAA